MVPRIPVALPPLMKLVCVEVGSPNTMGATFIDYNIVDAGVVPPRTCQVDQTRDALERCLCL